MTIQKRTTLDSDTTKPSVTQPGDGPADTTDPNQRATSVNPQPGEESLKVGTVNAVRLLPAPEPAPPIENPRFERYIALAPNGDEVTMLHNLDTGETTIEKREAAS
jgi:hypothetical protein